VSTLPCEVVKFISNSYVRDTVAYFPCWHCPMQTHRLAVE